MDGSMDRSMDIWLEDRWIAGLLDRWIDRQILVRGEAESSGVEGKVTGREK